MHPLDTPHIEVEEGMAIPAAESRGALYQEAIAGNRSDEARLRPLHRAGWGGEGDEQCGGCAEWRVQEPAESGSGTRVVCLGRAMGLFAHRLPLPFGLARSLPRVARGGRLVARWLCGLGPA